MGKLDLSALKDQYQNGTIDMITVAGVDMQGKLFGKKVPVRYFLDDAVHGIHT
ncbi:hypothetical protein P9G84_30325 [Brevibacillus centrosporus]|nr:hypothetical protein [Brevibacillus centrosporus]MEC2133154.1 hypothetical protein [Brevibacillus centrosporus]GED31247.1 hypothetical protein BCE02nite_23880 [Brevibacillus centrosporus]